MTDEQLNEIEVRAEAISNPLDCSVNSPCRKDRKELVAKVRLLQVEVDRLRAALRDAAETMEWVLAGQPGGTFFTKYKGRVQDSLRSARQAVATEKGEGK